MPWHWASHWALQQITPITGSVVVDLGAGNNPILRDALSSVGANVVLIDTMPVPAEVTGQMAVAANMATLPLRDGSCDFAVSVSALEHLPRDAQAATLKEIYRALKPGGIAALTFGQLFNANDEAVELLVSLPFFVDRGCPVYLPLDIRAAVEKSGFSAEDMPSELGDDLLGTPGLVVEEWRPYEQLSEYPCLQAISHCEVGVTLVKP